MKIKMYFLLLISAFLFYACSSDPEEKDPTALELLAGTYQTPWLQIDNGNGIVTIEIDSSYLDLNSNYTYSLFIRATLSNSDSVIQIDQTGTFEIPQSKYDKYVDQTIPIETLDGKIMFYPEGKNPWGADFSFSFEMFNLKDNIKIEEVTFSNLLWIKLVD